MAHMVKDLPAVRKTQLQSLSREDPLEKEMATHSSFLAWKIPWTEEPDGYSPWGHKELDTTERLTLSLSKEIKPEYSLDAEAPILWPPHVTNWLIRKDPNAGRD